MNGFSKIPQKTESIDVISGIEFDIDTKGLDCIIRPEGTDISVFVKPGASLSEKFPVKDGEAFEFCGKLYFMASVSGTVHCFMYKTL